MTNTLEQYLGSRITEGMKGAFDDTSRGKLHFRPAIESALSSELNISGLRRWRDGMWHIIQMRSDSWTSRVRAAIPGSMIEQAIKEVAEALRAELIARGYEQREGDAEALARIAVLALDGNRQGRVDAMVSAAKDKLAENRHASS